jgi:hypothetical protein
MGFVVYRVNPKGRIRSCIAAFDGASNAVCDANGVVRRNGIDLHNAGCFNIV